MFIHKKKTIPNHISKLLINKLDGLIFSFYLVRLNKRKKEDNNNNNLKEGDEQISIHL